MKKVVILGSTGSIGTQTLDVIERLQSEFEVLAISGRSSLKKLAEQDKRFRPKYIAVWDEGAAKELSRLGVGAKILIGMEGLEEIASLSEADVVVSAMSGAVGLLPTLAAIRAGKRVGLANKEVLVMAGELMMKEVHINGCELLPIDSEHSALFQCLTGQDQEAISRVILTASGGPFREYSKKQLEKVTKKDALNHPTWSMGAKITVDSSTLMNKGLEVIEARWLFGLAPEQIDVIVHPESIIHSLVEYLDGSMLSQLSVPTMEVPIQYALTYPNRRSGPLQPFDFIRNSQLEFHPPDKEKFPCLQLAYDAIEKRGSAACFLNAVNEVLVESFLQEEIRWIEIGQLLLELLDQHRPVSIDSIDRAIEIDQMAREQTKALLTKRHRILPC